CGATPLSYSLAPFPTIKIAAALIPDAIPQRPHDYDHRESAMAKTADYDLGPFTYPRGWLMVAASSSVTSIPSEGRFFGEDVVLYRGESGRAVMLNAYCPHMGAHLAVGSTGATARHCVQVVGDSIRC